MRFVSEPTAPGGEWLEIDGSELALARLREHLHSQGWCQCLPPIRASRIMAAPWSTPVPSSVWEMVIEPTKKTMASKTAYDAIEPWWDVGVSRLAVESRGALKIMRLDESFGGALDVPVLTQRAKPLHIVIMTQHRQDGITAEIYPNCMIQQFCWPADSTSVEVHFISDQCVGLPFYSVPD